MVLVAAFYYLTSRIRGTRPVHGPGPGPARHAGRRALRAHRRGPLAGRYELLYSPTGAVYGVGYTDNLVNLPGRAAMTLVALVSAGLMLYGGLRLVREPHLHRRRRPLGRPSTS
jgi:uncharacterized protein